MSAHTQSPDSRRPTSASDFASDLAQSSEHSRHQGQIQPRSILRQHQSHHSVSDSRGGPLDFESQSRTSFHRDRCPGGMQFPTPRVSLVDAENDSVARACGKTPSPALRYQPESYRAQLRPHRGSESSVPKKPQPPRARAENPRELYGMLHNLLVSCDSAQDGRRLRVWDYLEWQDILAVQGWDYKGREERDRERRRFAQMRKNSHTEVDPKMGALLSGVSKLSLTVFAIYVVVLGAPLRDVILYASTTTTMGGITYDVPIIVHSCVEALLRTSSSLP